jgi:hypothetical protein
MSKILFVLLFSVISSHTFTQKKYNFDIPARAKSNEGVYDWFVEQLDDSCDSLLNEMFCSLDIDTDSIQWIYPTNLYFVLHEKCWDYYSRRVYIANDKDKIIEFHQKNISENKLPQSLFDLNYIYRDGITTLILVEYY